MEDLIKRWKAFAKEDEDKNFSFVRAMKFRSSSKVDRIARRVHQEVFEEINCLECGNCCRTLQTPFDKAAVKRVSDHLGISPTEFTTRYLEEDEFGDMVTKSQLCPFLNDATNECTIYEIRPAGCRDYPYTHKSNFASRSYTHAANSLTCPAVYHILERMKVEMGWRD